MAQGTKRCNGFVNWQITSSIIVVIHTPGSIDWPSRKKLLWEKHFSRVMSRAPFFKVQSVSQKQSNSATLWYIIFNIQARIIIFQQLPKLGPEGPKLHWHRKSWKFTIIFIKVWYLLGYHTYSTNTDPWHPVKLVSNTWSPSGPTPVFKNSVGF
jgi:hypothetical protein